MDEKQIGTFSDLKAMQQIPYDLLSHVRLDEMMRPFRYRWETDAWSLNYEFTERLLKEFHLLRFSPKSPDKYLRDYGHNLGKLFCDLPKEDRQACELNYQEGIVDEAAMKMKFGRKRNLQAFEGWLSVKYPRKGDYECHRISKMFEISTKELNQERKTFRHSLCQYASQHTVGEVFSWVEEQAQRKPTVMDIFPVPDVYFPVRTSNSWEPTHCTRWSLEIPDCLPDKVCKTPWQEIVMSTRNQSSLGFIQDYLSSLDKKRDYIDLRYEYQLLERPLFQFLLVSDRLWYYYWVKAKMWQRKEGEQML